MFCPECGVEYGREFTTCVDCKVLLVEGRTERSGEQPPNKPPVVCANCGHTNPPEAQLCIRCGVRFYQYAPPAPPQYYPPPKEPGVSTGVKIGIGIVVGMLIAMGGCVACGVFLVGNTARRVQDRVQDRGQEKEHSAGAAVLLLKFEDLKTKNQYGYTTLTGRVRNDSDFTFNWVKVGVDWRDQNDRTVDSDYTYLVAGEALPSGAAKAFQIMSKQDRQAAGYKMKISEAR